MDATNTCSTGCAGPCEQGRRDCRGHALPMPRSTAWLIRNPAALGPIMGAGIVCAVATLAILAWGWAA